MNNLDISLIRETDAFEGTITFPWSDSLSTKFRQEFLEHFKPITANFSVPLEEFFPIKIKMRKEILESPLKNLKKLQLGRLVNLGRFSAEKILTFLWNHYLFLV